jgi:Transposase IS66 family
MFVARAWPKPDVDYPVRERICSAVPGRTTARRYHPQGHYHAPSRSRPDSVFVFPDSLRVSRRSRSCSTGKQRRSGRNAPDAPEVRALRDALAGGAIVATTGVILQESRSPSRMPGVSSTICTRSAAAAALSMWRPARLGCRTRLCRLGRTCAPWPCTCWCSSTCRSSGAGRDLLEFCRDRRDDVLRFCYDTRVWPTNNISERGIRPLKTQQKISGRLTSTRATQNRLDIRGYIDTARKHGQDVLTVLRSAVTGNPWTPPLPAATPA